MEDKLLVIKESDLNKLTKSAGVTYPTFSASEVFEAGRSKIVICEDVFGEKVIDIEFETYTDYEKTKI